MQKQTIPLLSRVLITSIRKRVRVTFLFSLVMPLALATLCAADAQAQTVRWSAIVSNLGALASSATPRVCLRILAGGDPVVFDTAAAYVDVLWLEGMLECDDTAARVLEVNQIIIAESGASKVGQEGAPFINAAEIRLTDTAACTATWDLPTSSVQPRCHRRTQRLH
jgi:hypothetical protein